jgi:mono/diheme cytochrome c family protein
MRSTPLIAFAAAASLAGCGGEKPSGGAVRTASASPAPAAAMMAAPDGQQLYQRCVICHQATGLGVPGSFPPLAGSEWATAANAALPIRVVLRGLQGPVTVKGKAYNSMMPAFGTGQPMSDADVAAVLTYVRSAWGNKASAVAAADVAKERAATASHTAPFTAKELQPLLSAGN